MPITTTVKINGTAVGCPRPILLRSAVIYRKGGVPTATFQVRGGKLAGLPDPYTGKVFSIDIDTGSGPVRYLTGDVTGFEPDFAEGLGWVRTYTAAGLRNRGDWVPHTDSNTGLDTSVYNASQDNQSSDFQLARSGRTVGQILTDVLTMTVNANALSALGLGNYTFPGSVPTLPTATVTSLAALTLVPQAPVYFGGETLLGAVESFLAAWAPNHCLSINPADGTFLFLDQRTFTAATLTMGTDPILPTKLRRDVSGCFQRVVVRGQPIAEMFAIPLNTTAGEAPSRTTGSRWPRRSPTGSRATTRTPARPPARRPPRRGSAGARVDALLRRRRLRLVRPRTTRSSSPAAGGPGRPATGSRTPAARSTPT